MSRQREHGSRPAVSLLLTFIALLLGSGCQLFRPGKKSTEADGITFSMGDATATEKLREAIRRFANRFSNGIQGAATRIVHNTQDLEVRRQAILWRLFAIQQGRDAAFQRDALAALMDMWILCVQMREFFESAGSGSDSFADQSHIALEASNKLVADVEGIAELALPDEHIAEARDAVASFAEKHPIEPPFTRRTYNSFLTEASKTQYFDWIFDASLAPLRAIGGMDETALAIHRVADVADEMNMVVGFMPERVHLQTQLLLYDPEVQSVLESVERISTSSDRLSDTAEKLPEVLSSEVGASLDKLQEHREQVQQTFEELRTTLAKAETTLVAIQRAAADLGQAGKSWEGTVEAIHAMVNDFRGADENGETDDVSETDDGSAPDRRFDVREYGESARQIGEAATRLEEASAEVRSVLSSEPTVVNKAVEGIGRIVDRVILGSILLVLALFGGALAYAWLRRSW